MSGSSAQYPRPTRHAGRPARHRRTVAAFCGLLAAAAALTVTPTATAEDRNSGQSGATAGVAQLATADAAVRRADVAGTAWYADATTGRLVLTADRTVSPDALARIRDVVRRTAPGALEIRRTPGRIAAHTAGGDPIVGPGGSRCAVGFNVIGFSGIKYALTAGHCGTLGGTWSPVGGVVASTFPGSDFALLRYTDQSQAEGGVRASGGGLTDITDARNPVVGETACVSAPSGVHCGTISGLNVTVNYGDGIVSGLIRANICTEPGDSGAPLYAGHSALGLVSGGNSTCSSGGTTYFQPVVEALNVYGVSVL